MKKLLMITLSLLFFTFLISPVQAKRPGPLDRPLADYNNLSLRQIFEDGQQLLNYEFDNGTTDWLFSTGTTFSVNNGIATILVDRQNGSIKQTNRNYIPNNLYYYGAKIDNQNRPNIRVVITDNTYWTYFFAFDAFSGYQFKSAIQLLPANVSSNTGVRNFEIRDNNTSGYLNIYADTGILLNLTSLGIPTATKLEMDNLYLDYLKYKDMMNATDVMLIVGQLGAFVWSLVVSFEIFGFVLWEYALFGIGAGFIGYLALKIIQKKAGDDNGDSD